MYYYIDYIHLHSYQEEFVKKMVLKLILVTNAAMVSVPGGEFFSKLKAKTGIFYNHNFTTFYFLINVSI